MKLIWSKLTKMSQTKINSIGIPASLTAVISTPQANQSVLDQPTSNVKVKIQKSLPVLSNEAKKSTSLMNPSISVA